MSDKLLSEMLFSEVFDEERPKHATSARAWAAVAGRYAAAYAFEFDRATALEAEVARLTRGLRAMARKCVRDVGEAWQDVSGEAVLTGAELDEAAGCIMREVMAEIDGEGGAET